MFQPERYEYQVKEDETVQIKLQSTFPVGCMFGNSDEKRMGCAYTMHLSMPNYQIGNDEKQEKVCERNVEQLNLAIEQYSCHVSIPSIAWNEPIIINVTGYINGKYDYRDRISYLKIKHQIGNSPGIPNPWDDSEVPEIKVTIEIYCMVVVVKCFMFLDKTHSFRAFMYIYIYIVHTLVNCCGYYVESNLIVSF